MLHADPDRLHSLAADLMEPIRSLVDRYVLELSTWRAFAARDFFEWCKLVGRVAEDLASVLGGANFIART